MPDDNVFLGLFLYTVVGVSVMMAGRFLSGIEQIERLLLSIALCSIGCVMLGVLFASWWG